MRARIVFGYAVAAFSVIFAGTGVLLFSRPLIAAFAAPFLVLGVALVYSGYRRELDD